jgi:hypothetical protein
MFKNCTDEIQIYNVKTFQTEIASDRYIGEKSRYYGLQDTTVHVAIRRNEVRTSRDGSQGILQAVVTSVPTNRTFQATSLLLM